MSDHQDGVIITVKEQANGDLRSLHEPGRVSAALKLLAAQIDRSPGEWRIVCISTPSTIRGDLGIAKNSPRSQRGYVEALLLSRIDRLDLLDPTIVPRWPSKYR